MTNVRMWRTRHTRQESGLDGGEGVTATKRWREADGGRETRGHIGGMRVRRGAGVQQHSWFMCPESLSDTCLLGRNMLGMLFLILSAQSECSHPA